MILTSCLTWWSVSYRKTGVIWGNILLSVGMCEIGEDCCWTAKHVGTKVHRRILQWMKFLCCLYQLLSYAIVRSRFYVENLRWKTFLQNGLVRVTKMKYIWFAEIWHFGNCILEFVTYVFCTFCNVSCIQQHTKPTNSNHLIQKLAKLESYTICGSAFVLFSDREVYRCFMEGMFLQYSTVLNVTLVDIFEALDFVPNHPFM